MIKFSLETINSEIAREYLDANNSNRSLRKPRVQSYARDMKAGKFIATHQCIAFNAEGALIDGQHRLAAVIESGVTVQMYVARYDSSHTALQLPLDTGMSRAAFEVVHSSKWHAETASCIVKIQHGDFRALTTSEISDCLEKFKTEIDLVAAANGKTVKRRTSAGARAAIVLLLRQHPECTEEILDQYKKFALLDIDGMWPSVAACARALENCSYTGGGQAAKAIAVRVWYAFTPKRKDMKLVRILNENEFIFEMQGVN